MCGICGELNFKNNTVTPLNIKRMMDSLIHRGPDDSGIYTDCFIGLGHRRLSIIDLSSKGRQPMWSNDKTLCITFNGEVYNFQEIKKELLSEGYYFESSTDTEVIVNAIHCWGIETAVSKFIGMFAFALWDNRNKILYLCRDRAGIKPLYYYKTDKLFLFASEMKAMMGHPDFRKELNQIALAQYFVIGYFLNNYTVFKNTFKLQPGHYLSIDQKGILRLYKYWGLETIKNNSFKGSFEDATLQLERILESAFKYRLVSDVPVGLFLSGGNDSSLVSALLQKRIGADILNITIGFNEKNYNEAEKAESVSRELGIRHVTHYITREEAQDTLGKFCDIYDEPFGDTSGIPTYILSKLARNYVKVALSADGGDEQFCGYESYNSYAKGYYLLRNIPWAVRFILSKILKDLVPYRLLLSRNLSKKNELLLNAQIIARYEKMLDLLKIDNFKDLIRIMNEKAWTQKNISKFLDVKKESIFRDTILFNPDLSDTREEIMQSMMRVDYSTFLCDDILVKVDRASMAVSLECRDPLLDHRIAEFTYSLPINYLFNHGEHKRILKHLLRKWLSDNIVSSPKRGFVIPLYYWLKGVWKPIVIEYLSKEKVKLIGFLDEKKVQREVEQFYKYDGCRAEKIWMMLNFQMWAEKWYQN